jgi:hypothetical protein
VIKVACKTITGTHDCNGRDTSMDGQTVTFTVTTPDGTTTHIVTLQGGEGNFALSIESGPVTVCETSTPAAVVAFFIGSNVRPTSFGNRCVTFDAEVIASRQPISVVFYNQFEHQKETPTAPATSTPEQTATTVPTQPGKTPTVTPTKPVHHETPVPTAKPTKPVVVPQGPGNTPTTKPPAQKPVKVTVKPGKEKPAAKTTPGVTTFPVTGAGTTAATDPSNLWFWMLTAAGILLLGGITRLRRERRR